MLEYDRIDVSERVTQVYYSHLLLNSWSNFRFQTNVCDGSHDLTQKDMSFNDVAIVSINGNYYRINLLCMSKDEAINIMKFADLK